MYVFAATFWTFDVAFFVFRKSKDYFIWLLAIFAVELIAGHGDLRRNARVAELLIYGVRSRIAGVKASSYLEGGLFPVTAAFIRWGPSQLLPRAPGEGGAHSYAPPLRPS
jgi:hypothetical protein